MAGRAYASGAEQDREVLTAREMEALSLIARGFTDREIAELLTISLSTARKHRENAQRKLGLNKSAQMTIHYLEHCIFNDKKNRLPHFPRP